MTTEHNLRNATKKAFGSVGTRYVSVPLKSLDIYNHPFNSSFDPRYRPYWDTSSPPTNHASRYQGFIPSQTFRGTSLQPSLLPLSSATSNWLNKLDVAPRSYRATEEQRIDEDIGTDENELPDAVRISIQSVLSSSESALDRDVDSAATCPLPPTPERQTAYEKEPLSPSEYLSVLEAIAELDIPDLTEEDSFASDNSAISFVKELEELGIYIGNPGEVPPEISTADIVIREPKGKEREEYIDLTDGAEEERKMAERVARRERHLTKEIREAGEGPSRVGYR
ncbi:hypothetical protein M422DRAFT_31700 [Sphaerobolus stellatus SS14]|uniref:Uncharacterized protein n=1 Tax=Sphaerobolus stellatus (strain SS14) TaxID=990650 RepID=A0A0C9VTL7_SPHS4|nr:hypothetical protein M422DRAFT_31700 [Sphaerobolus stellatus SS14]